MTGTIIPFNPLDKMNLGASVAEAMLARPAMPMGQLPKFNGAGIYAIYYTGNHPAYVQLAQANRNGFVAPIYVGKGIPAGGRKGASLDSDSSKTRALFNRLQEHVQSIQQAAPGLILDHFHARFLVVDDVWIPLAESLLIAKFSPVWNALIDGFGNHDPGKGRYEGMRPRWDVLHPGRPWAAKCAQRPETAVDIQRDVETYLRNAVLPRDQTLVAPNPNQP